MAKAKTKSKNVNFSWEGTNKKAQTIKGEMIAANADVVKAELRKQGITPKKGKIKKKGGGLFAAKGKKITTKDSNNSVPIRANIEVGKCENPRIRNNLHFFPATTKASYILSPV